MHAGSRPGGAVGAATFRPPRSLGAALGLAGVAWSLVMAVVALTVAVTGPAEFKTFLAWLVVGVLLVVAGTLLNWTYGVLSLAYIVDNNNITVRWGFRKVVVPLDTILRIVPGRTLDAVRVHGLNWPGCHIGHADIPRIGYALFYATHRKQEELLVLHTTEEAYAFTVIDQAAFAENVQSRMTVATLEPHTQHAEATGIGAIPFWRDPIAIVASLGSIAACALLAGFITYRYPGLPEVVQLNFPRFGALVRVGDKQEILKIVYLGVGILATNLIVGIAVHARERAAGLWILVSGGMLQAVLIGAAVVAIERS